MATLNSGKHERNIATGEDRVENKFSLLALMVGLIGLFFLFAGDAPPGVNEAHYLVKAKNFWNPDYLANDLFASSGKAHAIFDVLFGWPTLFVSLETTAWLGRLVGWSLLAIGLIRFCESLIDGSTARFWPPLLVAVLWIIGIYHGNLAGEWVVGGIEAKVPAYGLVLIGLADAVSGRMDRGWIWLGSASALHVLTGGWTVLACMIGCWWTTGFDRGDSPITPFWSRGLFIGGAFALLGVIPAAMMSFDGSGQSSVASMIYVYDRIPHHLLPANFHAWWYFRHAIVIAGAMVCISNLPRNERRFETLRSICVGVFAIEMTGLALGMLPAVAPEFAASLLKFYWFRLSDAFWPLILAVCVTRIIVVNNHAGMAGVHGVLARCVAAGGVLAFAVASFDNASDGVPTSVENRLLGWRAEASREELQQTWRDWRAVCRWADQSTPPGTMFLTPRHQQTFKWYSSRPEVVNWKDVPQDAASLVQWKQRMAAVYPPTLGNIKVTINYDRLRGFRNQYGAQYMIVDHRVVEAPIPLQKVYPIDPRSNATYAVYDLPR